MRLLGLLVAAIVATSAAPQTIRIVATTTDMASLAAAVGGNIVTVESIVPAAADAESFEPRPGDLDRLRRASLLVRVGLGYDYWLDALVNRLGERRLMRGGSGYVDASAGVPLLEVRGQSVVNEGGHAHGAANPHYWLDPDNAIIVTAGIAEALARIAPTERDRFVANRQRFLDELRVRRQHWMETLAPHAGARLVAYHNSWPYFARRFRLDIAAFVEAKPGVAPSPAHLARLISEGRKAQVRAVIHEPYEPEEYSRLVASKLGVPFVALAISVGSAPGTEDYLSLIDHDVVALARALAAPRQ